MDPVAAEALAIVVDLAGLSAPLEQVDNGEWACGLCEAFSPSFVAMRHHPDCTWQRARHLANNRWQLEPAS